MSSNEILRTRPPAIDIYTATPGDNPGDKLYHVLLSPFAIPENAVLAAREAAGLIEDIKTPHTNDHFRSSVIIHPPITAEKAAIFSGVIARRVGASTVRKLDRSGTINKVIETSRVRPRTPGDISRVLRRRVLAYLNTRG